MKSSLQVQVKASPPSLPVEGKSFNAPKTMQGRHFSVIEGVKFIYQSIASIFYTMMVGLANLMTCYHYQRQQKAKGEQDNQLAIMVYNPKNPVQASLENAESEVKNAEVTYREAQRGLENVLRLKAPAVPNLAIFEIPNLFISYLFQNNKSPLLSEMTSDNQKKPISFIDYVVKRTKSLPKEKLQDELAAIFTEHRHHFNNQIPEDKAKAFFQAAMTLIFFLKQPENQFETALSEKDLQIQMTTIFNSIQKFYVHQVKPFSNLLIKGSKQRKQFMKNMKTFAEQTNKQQHIFKTPSSDSYICTLREKVAASHKILKEKQALLHALQAENGEVGQEKLLGSALA